MPKSTASAAYKAHGIEEVIPSTMGIDQYELGWSSDDEGDACDFAQGETGFNLRAKQHRSP